MGRWVRDRHGGRVVWRELLVMVVLLGHSSAGESQGTPAFPPVRLPRDMLDSWSGMQDATFSPDGQSLAFRRALSLRATLARFGDATIAEVWIAQAPRWRPERMVSGANANGGGWGSLSWSPDGRWLAASRGRGLAYQVVVWNAATHRLATQSPCLVMPGPKAAIPGDAGVIPWFGWTREDQILTLANARQCRAADSLFRLVEMGSMIEGATDAVAAWTASGRGLGPAVAVLDAGVPADTITFPQTALWAIDARTGASRLVTHGAYESVVASPVGGSAALLVRTGYDLPRAGEPLYQSTPFEANYQTAVRMVSLGLIRGRSAAVRGPVTIPRTPGRAIVPSSLRWSPNGSRLAYVEADRTHGTDPCAVVVAATGAGGEQRVCAPLGDLASAPPPSDSPADYGRERLAAAAIGWMGQGDLALRIAGRRNQGDSTVRTAASWGRADWFVVRSEGERVNLTRTFREVPQTVFAQAGRSLVAADSALFELWLAPNDSAPHVQSRTAWVRSPIGEVREIVPTGPDLIAWVRLAGDTTGALVVLDLGRQTVERLPAPPHAEVLATGGRPGRLVMVTQGSDRGYFREILISAHKRPHILAQFRLPPSNTPPPDYMEIGMPYRSERGDTLLAKVTLPMNYVPGRRYPMIVTVYLGDDGRECQRGVRHVPRTDDAYAGQGFIQLRPAMPYRRGDPPIDQLTNGVLPAIDEVVRLGYADSTRVGLWGHSFGGFSVYGLLTQTHRFRAAVAEAGIANFAAEYGSFSAVSRYTPGAMWNLWTLGEIETGQGQLGGPPWERPEVYVHNSPLFAADKITAPLLIVQGDQDRVPVEQGEQMFRALFRLGRRVELVRYWGEGHLIGGLYNQRDKQARELRWFETYLKGDSTTVPAVVNGGSTMSPVP